VNGKHPVLLPSIAAGAVNSKEITLKNTKTLHAGNKPNLKASMVPQQQARGTTSDQIMIDVEDSISD